GVLELLVVDAFRVTDGLDVADDAAVNLGRRDGALVARCRDLAGEARLPLIPDDLVHRLHGAVVGVAGPALTGRLHRRFPLRAFLVTEPQVLAHALAV